MRKYIKIIFAIHYSKPTSSFITFGIVLINSWFNFTVSSLNFTKLKVPKLFIKLPPMWTSSYISLFLWKQASWRYKENQRDYKWYYAIGPWPWGSSSCTCWTLTKFDYRDHSYLFEFTSYLNLLQWCSSIRPSSSIGLSLNLSNYQLHINSYTDLQLGQILQLAQTQMKKPLGAYLALLHGQLFQLRNIALWKLLHRLIIKFR